MRQGRFAPASARLALLFSATACVFLRPLRTWTTEATQSVIEGAGWTDHPLDYVLDRYPARVAGLPHPPSSGATEVGDEDIVQTLPPARHQKNHCAMYGQCGKLSSSFLARSLPCPTSQRATQPLGSHRDLVVEVCGQDFAETDVCCDEEQLNSLRESVRVAYVLTAACSACWNNFLRFFCEFTCSPDQSTFLNVTSTAVARDTGKLVVNSVDHLVSPTFGAGFFDSCNDVKFPADNSFVMQLIGGGAKNYLEFLGFMGERRTGGSPFQINFPPEDASAGILVGMNPPLRRCDDLDVDSRCSCVDCAATCPVLDPTPEQLAGPGCRVGTYSCLSLGLATAYALAVAATGLVLYVRSKRAPAGYEYSSLQPPSLPDDLPETPLAVRSPTESSAVSVGGVLVDRSWATTPYGKSFPERVNAYIEDFFYRLGYFCARHPLVVFLATFCFIITACLGWRHFEVETDPARLWVGPDSDAAVEKNYFDTHFGPFYRTQQLIITSTRPGEAVVAREAVRQVFLIEEAISNLKSRNGHMLNDLCFKPTGAACVVQSITGYWAGDRNRFEEDEDWPQYLDRCAHRPALCFPSFGQPIKADLVLGGFNNQEYLKASAMIVTYVINNSLDKDTVADAEVWEETLLDFLGGIFADPRFNLSGLKVDYMAESSVQRELERSSSADIYVIALSYVVMFLYASIALGFPISRSMTLRHVLVDTKFSLGLCGVLIVAAAVASAVGLCSFAGVRATMIIAEVIPFLVLAVGVDNVFILQHEFERRLTKHVVRSEENIMPRHTEEERQVWDGLVGTVNVTVRRRSFLNSSSTRASSSASRAPIDQGPFMNHDAVARCAAETLGRMGPSVLLAAVTETLAFSLGAFVDMPAVSAFAVYAATAIFLDFLLQITCFVAAMSLDARREAANLMDCLWCLRLRLAPRVFEEGFIRWFTRKYYAPALLDRTVRPAVIILFGGVLTFLSIKAVDVELGLDQQIALPRNSYLIPYFDALDAYFRLGPPLYFVIQADPTETNQLVNSFTPAKPSASLAYNSTTHAGQQTMCGRFSGCHLLSVASLIEQERKRPEVSRIAQPAAVWMDDFLHWLNPNIDTCCQFRKTDRSRPLAERQRCDEFDDPEDCEPCLAAVRWNATMEGMPEGKEFLDYLAHFLDAVPDEACALAGKAAYSSAIVTDRQVVAIVASHIRTYHTPLKSQRDYIAALGAGRRVARELSEVTGAKVFPYSVFYIFFDQYTALVPLALRLLSAALVAVFVVTSLLLGCVRVGVVITAVVAAVLVDLVGVMALWDVSLNAVSLVNLAIGAGIAVEFCTHIARAFVVSKAESAIHRAEMALVDVGSSVFSGITLTKFAGILVLATASSRIFEVYYFRVYLAIVLLSAAHGLVLLPVLLSTLDGPWPFPGRSSENGENGADVDAADLAAAAADEGRALLQSPGRGRRQVGSAAPSIVVNDDEDDEDDGDGGARVCDAADNGGEDLRGRHLT